MDLEQLQAFIRVAATQNFTRAAESLNVVQSTVTNRIQNLERTLGIELFVRDKFNIRLSSAGSSFLPYAERIVELFREGVKVVHFEKQFEAHLVVGATNALWEYFLFPIIGQYQNMHPAISIEMVTDHSPIIIQKMIDGIVDLAVTFYPANHAKIESIPIMEDSFELVASASFEVPQRPITPQQLESLSYVHMNWGGSYLDWFNHVFGNHYMFVTEVDHVSLILNYFKTSHITCFLPKFIASQLIEQQVAVRMPFQSELPLPTRQIYLIYRKDNPAHSSFGKLLELLRNNA
jgi:LysR family transcriptional repressor of citA